MIGGRCAAGEERRQAPDRARLRGVGVQDRRALGAHDPGEAHGREQVADRRDLAVQMRDRDDRDPELLGDVRHRLLALADAAGDEDRLVPALAEAGRQVRDVEGRPAHVQAGDRPEDPDRSVRRGQN